MRWFALAVLAMLAAPVLSPQAAAQEAAANRLRAGAAEVDVTPKEFPVNMPGGFNANQAHVANDPLHARALVLANGQTTIAMVLVDSLGMGPEPIDEAKALAAEKTGIPTDKMLVCSTHTHSAPSSNSKDGPAPAVAYRKQLIEGVAESIIQAHAKLQPASLGMAAHPLPEEVFNRRWYLKPGKMPLNPFGELDQVKMNPGTNPEVLDRPAGPTDPDVMVLSVENERGRPLALWANYALHYVGGVPRGMVSADYFGEFSRLMPARMRAGDDFVAMMSNGASGDINNIPFTVTRPPRAPFEQIRVVAQKAADAAWFAERKISDYKAEVPLGMVEREIRINYRMPTREQVAAAKAVLAITDEAEREKLPRLAEAYARRTLSAASRTGPLMAKLQAIRMGDYAVVGIPFEVLVEIGLEIKEKSPFEQTMVIGLANGRHGYLPTPEQHDLGGYETWLGTCHVQKDASVMITKNLLEMLDALK